MSATKYIFVNPAYGEREYQSKAAISRAIRGIVYSGASEGEKAQSFTPEDKTLGKVTCYFLGDVFCRVCPKRFKEKTAGKRFVFQVVAEPMIGGYMKSGVAKRGLRILREDGSHTQISFQPGALQDETNWRQELNATLRQVISPWIIEYSQILRAHMNYTPDVGMPVTIDSDLHLDHVDPPFVEIVDMFIEEKNITPCEDLFQPKEDDHRVRKLKDKVLGEDFIFFHAMRARMQLITAKTNLKKGAKKVAA